MVVRALTLRHLLTRSPAPHGRPRRTPLTRRRRRTPAAVATLAALAGGLAPCGEAAAAPLPATTAAVASPCPTPAAQAIHAAPGRGKTVALTFDDGPGPETPKVLAILRQNKVRATFFVVGANARTRPATLRQVAAQGHLIANHSATHPSFASLTRAQQLAQLRSASSSISAATGLRTCWFRPPFGAMNAATVAAARSQGMSTVIWNVDTLDWAAGTRLNSAGYLGIRARARAGVRLAHPLVLMHDGGASRPNMLHELPGIIAWYRAHGYTFVGLDGLTLTQATESGASGCSMFVDGHAVTTVGSSTCSA